MDNLPFILYNKAVFSWATMRFLLFSVVCSCEMENNSRRASTIRIGRTYRDAGRMKAALRPQGRRLFPAGAYASETGEGGAHGKAI